jgi:hypothetical protein
MKKLLFFVSFFMTSTVLAQSPAPVEPVIDPAPASATSSNTVLSPTSTSKDTVPSFLRPDPISFTAKVGIGSSFGPEALWLIGDVEVQLDKFVAIGPRFQYGSETGTDFFFTSLGPRFTVPFSYFEFGLNAGFGLAYRNVAGFEFNNFLSQSGVDLNLYLLKNLSLGVRYNINLISSQSETVMSDLTFTVGGHY